MSQASELAEKRYLAGVVPYAEAQDLPRYQRAERVAAAQKAAAEFKQAVQADPTHVLAWTALGDIALNYLGDTEEAIQAFTTCSNLEPDNDLPNCMLGMALLAAGRRQDAFEQFDKAIQGFQSVLEPGTRNPHYASWISEKLIEAGTYCCFHGAPEKALELYAAPIQMEFSPEDYPAKWPYEQGSPVVFKVRKDAYCRIGIALVMTGREREAADYLKAASGLDDLVDKPSFFEDLGYAYKQLGKIPEAIEAFETCLRILESSPIEIDTRHIRYELEQLQLQKRPKKRFGIF